MPIFTARFASAEEQEQWDEKVVSNPLGGNLLQSEAFAEVKAQYGWAVRFLVLESAEYTSYNLVLEKSFPFFGKLWYLTKGPDLAAVEHLPAALDAIRKLSSAQKLKVFAVKIEPDFLDGDAARSLLLASGLRKMPNLQPNDSTVLIDTTAEPEQILRSLSSRGRNAVRRAQREGVEVERVEPNEENYRIMYDLRAQTLAGKSSAGSREYAYYQKFWSGFVARGQGRLYFVREEGRVVVGAFVINYGRKGTYKDGGSSAKRARYGDSHLVQWVALNDLKNLPEPIVEYDLCGTPPADRIKDASHPYYGLGLFKTSFNKTVTDFVGCWDLPVDGFRYRLWSTVGERLARWINARRTGQEFY
ncbi:lipid II:glycine glycyltransferase FemX [Arthrobacter russicus]|uniref:Lipid II:glycine glycyltransferase (Peptidoglycan interpeptide bridge formation enzyme) n=1 Tax=Arthrobacter russicus TaxID=172040 RepID=A0ABU1JA19_9MICC|nr:peptidoglycan bridge formation glycyltransferase FemA/FemB family protein [Arthrobacter russicus]MDR6269276.1 lipid II:glycine glycyltransferase (peptidoglycan interpeptide bridge formation enzyme) [Arthrobacter russicus]